MPDIQNWYDWSIANWGTKWDCYEVDVSPPYIHFCTAWSLPLPVLVAISAQFSDLYFENEWIEETLESAGRVKLHKGDIVFENYETYYEWEQRKSIYIHSLNLKYNSDAYLEFLKEYANEPNDSITETCQYYLTLTSNF